MCLSVTTPGDTHSPSFPLCPWYQGHGGGGLQRLHPEPQPAPSPPHRPRTMAVVGSSAYGVDLHTLDGPLARPASSAPTALAQRRGEGAAPGMGHPAAASARPAAAQRARDCDSRADSAAAAATCPAAPEDTEAAAAQRLLQAADVIFSTAGLSGMGRWQICGGLLSC